MREFNSLLNYNALSASAECETMLLGRLGSELALVYHDTLQSPLPPGIQRLVDRLDTAEHDDRAGSSRIED